jgi:hypothetical protein
MKIMNTNKVIGFFIPQIKDQSMIIARSICDIAKVELPTEDKVYDAVAKVYGYKSFKALENASEKAKSIKPSYNNQRLNLTDSYQLTDDYIEEKLLIAFQSVIDADSILISECINLIGHYKADLTAFGGISESGFLEQKYPKHLQKPLNKNSLIYKMAVEHKAKKEKLLQQGNSTDPAKCKHLDPTSWTTANGNISSNVCLSCDTFWMSKNKH